MPPLSTTAPRISVGIFGGRLRLPLVLVVSAVHALWQSLLVGLAIEAVESGGATRWGAVRGLRAFPIALAVHVIGVAVLIAAQTLAGFGAAPSPPSSRSPSSSSRCGRSGSRP